MSNDINNSALLPDEVPGSVPGQQGSGEENFEFTWKHKLILWGIAGFVGFLPGILIIISLVINP